jgi:hypothetical protein
LFFAALLLPASALADTIVLKNGRRIVAAGVVEEGDRVSYETSAGRLSLPRSIVARIERGSGASLPGQAAAPELSPPPPSAAPRGEGDAIARAVVHNGSIDQDYLAGLERQATSGGPAAVERVVAAHVAAARFLIGKGEFEAAAEHYRVALRFAPDNLSALLDFSYFHLRRGEYSQALEQLESARRVAPDSPDVAKLLGWAYYGSNRLEPAIAEWKRALRLRGDPEVARALDKAERDLRVESAYREGQTAHFTLRYSGEETPELARGILKTLEAEFDEIESELDYSPPEPIAVILYTREAFSDVTRAPGWAGALNDGRLRIPVEGLSSVTTDLARVLKHELTHSFLHQMTLGRCPRWLQEGVAQWMEGKRSNEDASELVQTYEQAHKADAPPFLPSLEGPWERFSVGDVRFAYAWSLAAVETMIQVDGMRDLVRVLGRIRAGSSTGEALREVSHSDYADLEQRTAAYIRRTYLGSG